MKLLPEHSSWIHWKNNTDLFSFEGYLVVEAELPGDSVVGDVVGSCVLVDATELGVVSLKKECIVILFEIFFSDVYLSRVVLSMVIEDVVVLSVVGSKVVVGVSVLGVVLLKKYKLFAQIIFDCHLVVDRAPVVVVVVIPSNPNGLLVVVVSTTVELVVPEEVEVVPVCVVVTTRSSSPPLRVVTVDEVIDVVKYSVEVVDPPSEVESVVESTKLSGVGEGCTSAVVVDSLGIVSKGVAEWSVVLGAGRVVSVADSVNRVESVKGAEEATGVSDVGSGK